MDPVRVSDVAKPKRQDNRRHGRFALRSAANLSVVGVYRDLSNEYDISDDREKGCF